MNELDILMEPADVVFEAIKDLACREKPTLAARILAKAWPARPELRVYMAHFTYITYVWRPVFRKARLPFTGDRWLHLDERVKLKEAV